MTVGGGAHKRYDLPKIEWVKFGGEVKDWLRFWSQFETVDEDENLKPQQKYHYLVQATIPGSRAREVVESFPPTKESYPKAIASLKSRFGREDLLVEHYQRELLTLVVQNIVQKGKVPLSHVYDKIETQINNLETLGVTKDRSAGLLYPLVESCLNEDLLRIWQRTPECRAESVMEKRLDKLMEFLRGEVEGDMKIVAAGSGFGLNEVAKNRKKKEDLVEEKVPTAASLVDAKPTNQSKQRSETKSSCIFCEKSHASEHCFSARSLTLEQRSEKVKESGACFACLNKHRIADCRAKVKCIACEGRHLPILCRKLDSQKVKVPYELSKDAAIGVLENSSGTVLLQTLIVRLKYKNAHRLARALIDTGSQRSYVLSEVAAAMKLVPCRKEKMVHAVFGGSVSSQIEHECFELKISDLNNKHAYQLDVLDQTSICGSIPIAAKGPWVQELKTKGVNISDKHGPIEVLLGADFYGRILTGNNIMLKSGLLAVETCLGWTVIGMVPKLYQVEVSSCSMLSTTIESISKLWELDVLGIEDPSTVLNKKEAEEAVMQHFSETPICPLPRRRVEYVEPVFAKTGVDLAGPLHLREGQKVWIAIHTCVVYRAVHLEVVFSLSTESFLMSLRRFVARRSRPTDIYSDNGKHFRGADNAFENLDWRKIHEVSNLRRIKWIFLPPAGPWWGSWWKRLIRMLKGILRKSLGKSRLTLEELTTLVCDCEMLMNARPLTYISEDPKDLEPLTPAMFLRDIPESCMQEIDIIEGSSLEAKLRQRQKFRKTLKDKFRRDYLGQLVQHSSKGEDRKLLVGDVVILGSDGTRRQDWPLARVEELLPGRDGHCRVVRLRTATGQSVTRPLQRIYLLEGIRDKESLPRLRR